MKIYIERYSKNSDLLDGKTLFCNRLGAEFASQGMFVTGNREVEVDVSLNVVQIKHQKSKIKILRLDGVYFDSRLDYKTKNKKIAEGLKIADGVVYQSEFSKSMCDKYLGVYKGPSKIIFNGTILHKEGPVATSPYSRVFVTAARWRTFKRLEDTIQAFLLANVEDSVLYVMGDTSVSGVEPKKYSSFDNIKFLGVVSQEVLCSYLKIAKGAIHLSWFDSCPNSVVEAIAEGIPVICGNVGGTKELVSLSDGFVCNMDKPYELGVEDVYNPPKIELHEVAEAIVRCSEEFLQINNDHVDIKAVAKTYINFFKEIAA